MSINIPIPPTPTDDVPYFVGQGQSTYYGAGDYINEFFAFLWRLLTGGAPDFFERVKEWLLSGTPYIKMASLILTLVFLYGFFRLLWKYLRIRRTEKEKIRVLNEQYEKREEKIKNERWQKITEHIESADPPRWRLAIIEADIMLDDLLSGRGYLGDTIGDKLKGVDRGDFLSLDEAWSAHKIRNNIAHEGSDYILTQRQARGAVASYKKVFDEFKYI